MFVLSLSRKFQHIIGVHRENLDDPKNYAIKLLLNVLFILGMMSVLVLGSFAYILVNFMDLQSSTNAMIILMAGGSGAACYIGITSNTESIAKLYRILQNLADESLEYHGFYGFEEAEEKSYFLSKWFTMFVVLFFTFGTLMVSAGNSIWSMYRGDYNTATWFLPCNLILPVDRSTPSGWWIQFFLQPFTGYEFVLTITSTVTFYGGCCFYIEACFKQFKFMFEEVDKKIQAETEYELIEKDLFDIIIFHNKIFEVFETVAEIYSAAIFFHLICNVLFFASAIFQTEMSFGEVGLSLLFNVLCIMEGLAYTFILCYFANVASFSIAEMANVVYKSEWYNQPPQFQKLLVLIIARAQIPHVFMGFKMVYCSLESFTKLNKTAATYYIMFRNISTR